MKLRLGFVSNSSSSSCVLIGRRIGNPFVERFKLEAGKEYVMLGGYLADGVDVIAADQKLVDYLYGKNEANWDSCSYVIEVYDMLWRAYDTPLPETCPGASVWGLEVDDHGTENLEEFKERYPEIEEK